MEQNRRHRDVLELTVSDADLATVTEQLGRKPKGAFAVVVRDADGKPVVIRNAPLLHDGTPMPTLYWLTGAEQIHDIGQIEAAGGVDQAEAEVDPDALQAAHDRYAAERNAMLPPGFEGPTPYGGVGGTRKGVKCLHAHYAYLLAGGTDPVGDWIAKKLRAMKGHPPGPNGNA